MDLPHRMEGDPRHDLYIEKETEINEEIERLRLAATTALISRRDVIIVASVSCIYGLGSPDEFLKATVRKIYDVIRRTERYIAYQYDPITPILPASITFVHSEELQARFPGLTPREREFRICREHGAVFIIGIGSALPDGIPHDGRAPDYDDWSTPTAGGCRGLNGDILVYYPVLDCALELSSMGIRVDAEALLRQLEIRQVLELKGLVNPEHLWQLVIPDLLSDLPPLQSFNVIPNNLPAQPTELIGREAELTEIVKRLNSEEVRLLTLTGPGGIGKTRISLQPDAVLIESFKDGIYFVDLAPIRDPESVLIAIAETLSLRETSDRPLLDELKGQLRTKKMLLLLDNFEQVMEAAAKVVELLRDCPQLKLLVTSREALHVRGEYVFPVPPLTMPEADLKQLSIEQLTQYEAVQLFIERAQAVKPDFIVTNENALAVAEICWRLDGLPLAIELATARISLFSPQSLLERLGSRLKLPRGGARDLPRPVIVCNRIDHRKIKEHIGISNSKDLAHTTAKIMPDKMELLDAE